MCYVSDNHELHPIINITWHDREFGDKGKRCFSKGQ